MKKAIITLLLTVTTIVGAAQERRVENKPYIDLRPLHFGIVVGFNAQDIELENVGPQTFIREDGSQMTRTIVCDASKWNPGISVGVLADMRLSDYLSLRVTPTMHFGSKYLTFRDLDNVDDNGKAHTETQEMKNTYISFPIDLKFSSKRHNNYRPYLLAGISPMLNLTSKEQDLVQLKRFDTMIEIGVGCDLYLPFFKLIPELKFCYSLSNALDKNHVSQIKDDNLKAMASSVSAGHAKMIVLSFYFE